MFGFFSSWRERRRKRRERDRWLMDEFPEIALAKFQNFRDFDNRSGFDRPKKEIYEIIIKDFAHTFGVPNEYRDEYVEEILHTASLAGPLCLRMVVVSLICTTWRFKSELSFDFAMIRVKHIIPEDL